MMHGHPACDGLFVQVVRTVQVQQHWCRTKPTTWARNTSHNMIPEYVPQHGPRTHPTALVLAMFHTMGL